MKKINLNQLVMSWNEKQKPRRIGRYAAILIMILTLGVGQMWAGNSYVVGAAYTGSYDMVLNVNRQNWGWYKWDMTKADLTFEGRKLYIKSYETDNNWINNLQFLEMDGGKDGTQKGYHEVYSGSGSEGYNNNQIFNYNSNNWYTKLSFSTSARFYFDASTWDETSIKLVIGHANYQKYYSLSNITNTKLYYGKSSDEWGDAMHIGVVGGTSASDGTNWPTDISDKAAEYTGLKNYALSSDGAGNAYLMVPAGDAGEQPSMNYYATHYNANSLNFTQTIKYAVGVNGGDPATLTSGYVPADIAISSYKFVSGTYNAVSSSSGSVTLSKNGSNYSATVTAARTATTTYTVSNVDADYSFVGWYSAASGGTLLSSELSYTFYPTSATTAYARFSKENNHSVTISRYCTSTSTEISSTSAKIGEVTYSSIEAPEIYGYTFVNWTLGSGVTKHSSDALTSNPIRVITAASGSYTLTANYTEVLSTDWKLIGDNTANSPFGDDYSYASGKAMSKKSGYSSEYKAYKTLNITKTGDWGFKVASSSASANTYGWGTGDTKITFNRSKSGSKQDVYGGSQHELRFNPDGLGEYEFKVDYTASPCSVTVTFPTVYTVTFGKGTGGSTVTAKYSSVAFDSGTKVQSGKTVRFTQTASTGYTFKEWNTAQAGNGTQLSTSATYDRTVASTNNVYAIYTINNHNITYTSPTNGTYTIKVGSASAVSESTTSDYNQTITLAASNNTGYHFTGWTVSKAGGGSITPSSSATANPATFSMPDDDVTVSASFAPDEYTITYKDQGNVAFSGSHVNTPSTHPTSHTYGTATTLNSATKTGYTFGGWYTNSSCTGDAVTSLGATAYTANITLYAKWTENMTTVTLSASPVGKGTFTIGGAAATSTSAGVTTKPSVTAVAGTGYHLTGTIWSKNNSNITLSSATSNPTTVTGCGTAGTSSTLTATFTPNTYRVHFHRNGGSGSTVYQNFTYDVAQNLTANTYTRTGYNFAGWALATDGAVTYANSAEVSNLTSDNGVDFHLYAKWTPKQSALTLNYQTSAAGYYSSGSISNTEGLTGTYDSPMTALTGTMPSALPGYAFMGFFDATGGEGTKYYNADGSSAHVWDKNTTSGTTLYAHYEKAVITKLEHENSVAKEETAYLTVNPVLNITPENYVSICWSLLYADTDNPVDGSHWSVASTENGSKPNEVKYTLTNLANGSYKVKAVLKSNGSSFDACSTGTELDTETSTFRVVGNNTVTIRFRDFDLDATAPLRENSTADVPAMDSVEVTAPDILGYTFHGWSLGGLSSGVSFGYKDYGEGLRKSTTTDRTIVIKATYDGTITAYYDKKDMIYFNNALNWDTVYVYFYSSDKYWDASKGTGAQWDKTLNSVQAHYYHMWGGMTRIPGTDVYYLDYEDSITNAGWQAEIRNYVNVAFTDKPQGYGYGEDKKGFEFFHDNAQVVRRGDFDHSLSMFVPLSEPTTDMNNNGGKKATYYNQGFWMDYADSTGYILNIYYSSGESTPIKKIPFVYDTDSKLPLSVTTDLEAGHTYAFTIKRADGNIYKNTGTMSNGHSGDEGQTAWEFTTGAASKAQLTTSSAGYYTFTLKYGLDSKSAYNYLVGVRYPEATGDFRVQYKDNDHTTWKTSVVIPKMSDVDTVSYFVRKDETPFIKVQKCTATYKGEPKVTTVSWNDESAGANIISSLPSAITEDGVYNFIFKKNGDRTALVLDKVEPYTGNFYIRVDGAGSSNWDNYRASDHMMPYSDYSFKQTTDKYSHYFTKWYDCSGGNKNIKFVVANDYSTNVSDTITQDGVADSYVDAKGDLSRSANVRFMYNYKTNVATRRYVDGAYASDNDFLLLIPETSSMIYDAETDGTAYSKLRFTDTGNWIYEANVWVVPGATYQLKSTFGTDPAISQYLKGDYDGETNTYETLIAGSGSSRMQIRLVYDYKTNRLISAYMPSGIISASQAINADVMFVREGQNDMTQLTFTNDAELTNITNVYSVLRFNKWTLNNRSTTGAHAPVALPLSVYERSLYFISFPFDVKLSDVIGLGTYWNEWYIEYYDGAARAKNGFWIDSESYWKYVTPAMKDTFVLKAGTGYLFGLDLDYLVCDGEGEGQQADVWKNIQTADYIFPGTVSKITSSTVTYTLPAHTCTINRGTASGNRTIADSHWNVLGVPTYLNTESMTLGGEGASNENFVADGKLKFIYSWNPMDNSLSPTSASGFEYQAMHAYVVQYYGTITFTTSVSPTTAPRRNPDYRGEYEFRLDIQKDDETVDHTFIRLSDEEDVTVNFEFGHDLTKAQNGHAANIYTIVEGYLEAAGNSLPLTNQTTVVPVGVKVNTAGDFTFSMPEGTHGVGVTLIDNVTGVRTPLSALDYTVNLTAGTFNERFALEISPIAETPTDIDILNGENGENGVRKVIIDQKMYIIRGNEIFDARGAKVK